VLKAIAQSLGAHVLGDGAAEEATHLVLGSKTGAKGGGATGAKRTLKVLQAILRGAWVLSEQWLFESLDADELLPEAGFETSAFVGARRARERRQAGEPIQPLARTSVAIVEQDAAACERLVGLARLAGATLAPPTRADVVIDAVAHAKASSFASSKCLTSVALGPQRKVCICASNSQALTPFHCPSTVPRYDSVPSKVKHFTPSFTADVSTTLSHCLHQREICKEVEKSFLSLYSHISFRSQECSREHAWAPLRYA
jgi:hypothetical protein